MSDQILVQAKQAMTNLVSLCCRDTMVRPLDNEPPVSPSLLTMLVAWMVPALDYVMTGPNRIKLADKKFISQVTGLNLTIELIDSAGGAHRGRSRSTDVPVFGYFVQYSLRLGWRPFVG